MKVRVMLDTVNDGGLVRWLTYAVKKAKPFSPIKMVTVCFFVRTKTQIRETMFLSSYDVDIIKEMI